MAAKPRRSKRRGAGRLPKRYQDTDSEGTAAAASPRRTKRSTAGSPPTRYVAGPAFSHRRTAAVGERYPARLARKTIATATTDGTELPMTHVEAETEVEDDDEHIHIEDDDHNGESSGEGNDSECLGALIAAAKGAVSKEPSAQDRKTRSAEEEMDEDAGGDWETFLPSLQPASMEYGQASMYAEYGQPSYCGQPPGIPLALADPECFIGGAKGGQDREENGTEDELAVEERAKGTAAAKAASKATTMLGRSAGLPSAATELMQTRKLEAPDKQDKQAKKAAHPRGTPQQASRLAASLHRSAHEVVALEQGLCTFKERARAADARCMKLQLEIEALRQRNEGLHKAHEKSIGEMDARCGRLQQDNEEKLSEINALRRSNEVLCKAHAKRIGEMDASCGRLRWENEGMRYEIEVLRQRQPARVKHYERLRNHDFKRALRMSSPIGASSTAGADDDGKCARTRKYP